MNCELRLISRTISLYRPTFASSSGASTSSRRQNGVGLIRKMAKMSETAVKAFSPPERRFTDASFLPGGCATISTPGSADGFAGSSTSCSSALPPRKRRGNTCWKRSLTSWKVSRKRSFDARSIRAIADRSLAMASSRSAFWEERKAKRSPTSRASSMAVSDTSPSASIFSRSECICSSATVTSNCSAASFFAAATSVSSIRCRSRTCCSRWLISSRVPCSASSDLPRRSPTARASSRALRTSSSPPRSRSCACSYRARARPSSSRRRSDSARRRRSSSCATCPFACSAASRSLPWSISVRSFSRRDSTSERESRRRRSDRPTPSRRSAMAALLTLALVTSAWTDSARSRARDRSACSARSRASRSLCSPSPAATASREACSSRATSPIADSRCSVSCRSTWSRWAMRPRSSCSRATSRSRRRWESSSSRSS